ncbi:ATP-binding protein [Sphingomonas phyllosphaerae]|uniref:ATP-binding protein n=1 Tax=Sphingomonas phyllosphaerae TaxID=257003 RepID=UPI0024131F87|nr:ATP-binding protein [Sphingomonas phyllosphaerae]
MVNADRNQFESAVLNLVINARDAMPSGGTLSLLPAIVDGLPAVRGHGGAEGRFVALRVSDTGSGIAPDVLEKIFEPFFTTKEVNQGTGLGLSQVHGFAKQSGGEIDVHSELGIGTAFTLYLPLARGVVPVAASPSRIDTRPLPLRRVLLVEDNEAVGQFARGLLEELGQTVTWSLNGGAALELLERAHDEFDLVFTDVIMPGMSGLDLARAVRARWPALPVILTTGYSHALAAEQDHGFALLRKPYSLDGLAGILV